MKKFRQLNHYKQSPLKIKSMAISPKQRRKCCSISLEKAKKWLLSNEIITSNVSLEKQRQVDKTNCLAVLEKEKK